MKLARDKLVQHLQRIMCNGQINEAVFTGAFETTALSPDHQLLVVAPALPKTRVLAKKGEMVGVADLDLFRWAATVRAGTGNEAVNVDITFENHRLLIDEGTDRGVLDLKTADARTISTFIESEVVEKLFEKAPKEKGGVAITEDMADAICTTFRRMKVAEIELFIGPDGGMFRVGNPEVSHAYKRVCAELKAPQEYSLLFGEHLAHVLNVVTNYAEARLFFGGPDGFVLINDGGYKYILSSRAKSADEESA